MSVPSLQIQVPSIGEQVAPCLQLQVDEQLDANLPGEHEEEQSSPCNAKEMHFAR